MKGAVTSAHNSWRHEKTHLTSELWKPPLEGWDALERASDTPTGFQCRTGDASTVSSAWITIARASARYALSGVRGISRAKGTAARTDGLVIEFGRPDAVEVIMTEAKGPCTGLMARYECAMPRAGSTSKRAESVFVDEELFTVLAVLIYLHPVYLNL